MLIKMTSSFAARVCWKGSAILRQSASILQQFGRTPQYDWFTVHSGVLAGTKLYGDLNNGFTDRLKSGRYESFLYDAVAELGIEWESKTVWDVGSHFGYHTFTFAALTGDNGRVYAFEPNPYNVDRLTRQLAQNPLLSGRIAVQPIALSDCEDEQPFRYSGSDSGADLGYLSANGVPSDRIPATTYATFLEATVKVTTADKFVSEIPEALPDIIKIDVEGAEVNVLTGASQILQEHQPTLLIEIHNVRAMYHTLDRLYRSGYYVHLLDDPYATSSKAFIIARVRHE